MKQCKSMAIKRESSKIGGRAPGHAGKMGAQGHAGIEVAQGMLGRIPGPSSAPVGGEVSFRRGPTVQLGVKHGADLIKSSLH